MNYYNASGQMDLSDRIAIETGICIGESFKKIAKRLRRHPSTIAHEVKENRTFIKGNYPNGKDCRMARQCTVRNLCGCDEEACNTKCRTYEDFEYAMKFKYSEDEVTEMDTVKGVRESGKRLLTMIFRKNNVMLLFLMPDGKAESVKRVLDYLETGLGIDVFRRLFPVILTDNGSEFKKVDELELTLDEDGFLVYRTSLYYCDPMASWQKGCIEKNHEFIRYAVPKGKSLNPYTQEDMTLLMNHINSVKRPGLGNKSPYELVEEDDEDFKSLMSLLKMHLIPPDEVHLMPDLFVKK